MKKTSIIAAVALAAAACSPMSKMVETTRTEAETLFAEGRYGEALEKYKSMIAMNAGADSVVCRNMAIAAQRTGEYETAYHYGSMCKMAATDTMLLFAYGTALDQTGRAAESIALLEARREQFEQRYGADAMTEKRALHYAQQRDERLEGLYDQIKTDAARAKCFDAYFAMVKDKNSQAQNKKLCLDILKADGNQETALRYVATLLYDDAEAQYKKLMDDYNKKKNATTYAYLRRDLKRVSAVYRESKDNFEKLRKIDPQNKSYIKYLININLRLDQKDKAKELERLLS